MIGTCYATYVCMMRNQNTQGVDTMTEQKQAVIEYHRTGKSMLFCGKTFKHALAQFRKRYTKASDNTELLLHYRDIVSDGETTLFGELVYQGTFPLSCLKGTLE